MIFPWCDLWDRAPGRVQHNGFPQAIMVLPLQQKVMDVVRSGESMFPDKATAFHTYLGRGPKAIPTKNMGETYWMSRNSGYFRACSGYFLGAFPWLALSGMPFRPFQIPVRAKQYTSTGEEGSSQSPFHQAICRIERACSPCAGNQLSRQLPRSCQSRPNQAKGSLRLNGPNATGLLLQYTVAL